MVIPFIYVGERERFPCGKGYHIHAMRKIRLTAPPVGLHRKVFWVVEYLLYRYENCDGYATHYIPFRFEKDQAYTSFSYVWVF